MNTMLSSLSQGYGVCRKDGVILIPEAGGAIPAYSTQIKNAEGTLYGHFVPVPKTYLTRRGDIILFTENACDIVYLEEMYSRKIRELYEQQIKTVDDLNRSILFYGSKTPGEYSLNFIRGKFYSDRDIAVQPGHLPTHYLNSLTRHVKLNSVLRPRAPPGTGTGAVPLHVDPAVKNIKLPVPGLDVMESPDDIEDYDGTLVVKNERKERRAPSPVDMNRLPPIQVSKKYDSRPKKESTSPTLHKVGLNSNVLGLHGTNALPSKKDSSEIPTLPKVVTGPSAKGKSQEEWKKLGTLIGSVNVLKRISEGKQKEKDPIKGAEAAEEQKPIYRSAMAMDIHFLKENRRHISRGDPEAAIGGDLSLDDILVGLKERHGKKPILPPLQVQWSPELEKREMQEEEEEEKEIVAAEASSRKSSGHSRKSPKIFDVSHARRTSPYPKAELRNAQSVKKEIPPKPSSLDGKMISPFGERAKSRDSGSGVAKSRDPKPESRKSSARAEKQDEKPAEPPSIYKTSWSPEDPETVQVDMDAVAADIDIEYQDHIKQARELLALQKQRAEEEELRRLMEEDGRESTPNSIPALFVDDTEQVYVGEIYGDVQADKSLNQNLPFDYMGLVRSLSRRGNNAPDSGELSLQSQSLGGGGSLSQPLQPGLYVMRPSNTEQYAPNLSQSNAPLGIGNAEGGRFTEKVDRRVPRSAKHRANVKPTNIEEGKSLAPESAGLNVPKAGIDRPTTKGGYVYREQVREESAVTPDHRLPQRILHQKDPNSTYVLKKGGDHSFLDVPQRQQGTRSESSKKESSYVLRQSLPQTGVPAGHDHSRRLHRQSKRRRKVPVSQAKNVYPSFTMGSTTREIIGALESNGDTSTFDSDHVQTAMAIRDQLKASDPNFSIEKMAADSSSGNAEKDLQDAEKYLAELSSLREEAEVAAAAMANVDSAGEEEYYDDNDYYDDENYDGEQSQDWSPHPASVPGQPPVTPASPYNHNQHDYKHSSDPTHGTLENGATQKPNNNTSQQLVQDYIKLPLCESETSNTGELCDPTQQLGDEISGGYTDGHHAPSSADGVFVPSGETLEDKHSDIPGKTGKKPGSVPGFKNVLERHPWDKVRGRLATDDKNFAGHPNDASQAHPGDIIHQDPSRATVEQPANLSGTSLQGSRETAQTSDLPPGMEYSHGDDRDSKPAHFQRGKDGDAARTSNREYAIPGAGEGETRSPPRLLVDDPVNGRQRYPLSGEYLERPYVPSQNAHGEIHDDDDYEERHIDGDKPLNSNGALSSDVMETEINDHVTTENSFSSSPERAVKQRGLEHINSFMGGTPDLDRAPGFPLRSMSPSIPLQTDSANSSPRDGTSVHSPGNSGFNLSPPSQVKVNIRSFGSSEVPHLPTLGDERYVINPSVPYPSGPQQEAVHYSTHRMKGGYDPSTSQGVLGHLPKRKLPPHLLLRSQASTPVPRVGSSRVRKSNKASPPNRPKSAQAVFSYGDLSTALMDVTNVPDIKIGSPSTSGTGVGSLRSSSTDSGMLDGGSREGGYEQRLEDTAHNLEKIVKLRSELADNFQHNSCTDLDMFSDITDSEVAPTPLRESDLMSDLAVPGLLDIPEEATGQDKGTKKKSSPLDGCHAGVYLTQLYRDGMWTNEDVPVYVTPDGKVFISSVIVNQPVCSSDRIKFAQQDDADDVHNKPEEGSITFSDGKLTGWVKFPGQKAVKIRGKRWDPRQTGHYVIEKRVLSDPEETESSDKNTVSEGKDRDGSWQLVPLELSIMLGGKVTINEKPVYNPLFEENIFKLQLDGNEQSGDMKCIVASFDPTCTKFKGKLSTDLEADTPIRNKSGHQEVEIRGRKWNPSLVGHYYSLKKSDKGGWDPYNLPIEIQPSGAMLVKDEGLGVPPYNGNEIELLDLESESLPDNISLTFLDGKYVGITESEGKKEEIRGIRWDPSMIGKYSIQEKVDDTWINKLEILSVTPNGSVDYDGRTLEQGFIVDNKVFVVDEGGVDSFFNNTGPVSDANLSGQSFLMQRDSPVRKILPVKPTSMVTEKEKGKTTEKVAATAIQEAEIVFSSNRFYGHVTSDKESEFVEIRGYKWDEAIAGEYFTEVLKEDGSWGGGPTITVTPDGEVQVDGEPMLDTLLKDTIVSISDISVPNRRPLQQCLVAIQDKLLSGWIQESDTSPKIQIRGSLWKEGPGAHGSYVCTEKVDDKWISSNKSVIVTPSNKVRISELSLEGEMDGLSARLELALSASTDSIDSTTVAKLRFEGDTFSGKISSQDVVTEIAGFKFETVPGVYLLECRPVNSEEDWTGLDLQLVVSENSRISISGNAVYNVKANDGTLEFESTSILEKFTKLQFLDKSIVAQGQLLGKDGNLSEVEIRGSTWQPKIAGTYETELFTDSGWKASKKLEITPQGEVLFGNEPADNVRLDSDTVTFGSVDDQLKDVTLAFDNDGFTGNVMTMKDKKNRVMRGKRVGTRPVSASSATELSLGNDEEDSFNDLNGQIGSTIKRKSAGKRSDENTLPDPAVPFVTSDYGSASDVITQQLSGSRTEGLSSLEEDISMRSKSPSNKSEEAKIPMQGRRSADKYNSEKSYSKLSPRSSPRSRGAEYRTSSGKSLAGSPTRSNGGAPSSTNRKSPRNSLRSGSSGHRGSQDNVDLGDISLDLDGSDNNGEGGVSFESWPPKNEEEGKAELNLDMPEAADAGVKLDILPKGLSSLGKAETKNSIEVVSPSDTSEASTKSKTLAQKSLTKAERAANATPADSVKAPSSIASDRRSDKTEASDDRSEKSEASSDRSDKTEASGYRSDKTEALGDRSDKTEASGDKSAEPELEALNDSSPALGESSPEQDSDNSVASHGLLKDTPKLPDIGGSGSIAGSGSIDLDQDGLGKTIRSPDDSPRSLEAPALTKPVKLPGIDMREKGAAAEITEDAGLLKNYIDPKSKKKGGRKKAKKPKKVKGKNELRPDLYKDGEKKDGFESGSPVDVKEKARQGIEQAQLRRTPTARTPVHMAKIDRDSSRDSTPISSGYTTPNSGNLTPSSSFPQREFQGALMAAKKIRETVDHELDGKIPSDIREHPVAEEVAEKFGMEMQVRDDDSSKLSVKERRELARQRKKEDADRRRRERDEEKRRLKEEEERRLAEEEEMKQRRAEREAELAAERQRELERRKEEEARRRQAKLEERDRRKRDEEKMMDAKRKLEEELKRRRAAEAARLEEIERQKQLELEREREEQEKRMAEAEALRAQMEEEMAREMAEYERKVREEQERRRIEEALKAEAERRLLDEEERKRIIALARHLWNKGVRIEGENIEQELEISSIFYSYFNYLQSEEPYNPEIDISYKEKVLRLESSVKNRPLDKI